MIAKNLTIGYPGASQPLFENLTLSLRQGELVCFMGPNGIGKSTLIRTLAGLQKPLRGDVNTIDPTAVALVLTDRITASQMTVYDLISYGRYPYLGWNVQLNEEDRQKITNAIRLIHIEALCNKRLYELSDGQMQLAMIARALAQETPYLLLDEPTAHLDLNNRVEIMNILRNLARTMNKAILVATHELDLALQTADWVWLATGKKTIKTGIPEDLVLDGSFDEVFQLKGFDLKTGKVQHDPYQGRSIELLGTGHDYLWTKNAVERSGYLVATNADLSVEILNKGNLPQWKLITPKETTAFDRIEDLLLYLKSQSS